MSERRRQGDALHDELLRALRAQHGQQLEQVVEQSRAGLVELRRAYRRGDPPDFGVPAVRLAYMLGYHPAHVLAAWWAYDAMGPIALGIHREELHVVNLGAGPGAEIDAFTRFAADRLPSLRRITFHLIDREPAWRDARGITLANIKARLPEVQIDLQEHQADLTDPDELTVILPLIRSADLVTAQTLLTEVASQGNPQTLLDVLAASMGPDARLLFMDLHRVEAGAQTLVAASRLPGIRTFWECSQVLPLGSPPALLREHFWESKSGRKARTKIHVTARLMGRPGMATSFLVDDSTPTDSQAAVLEGFPNFLADGPPSAVLTGIAGTGKTTLAKKLAKLATDQGFTVRLLAPTGQAARRIGSRVGMSASTIHGELYAYERTSTDDEGHATTTFSTRPPAPVPALWIVDEASMVGNRPYREREEDVAARLIFGEGALLRDLVEYTLHHPDSKLLLIGDTNQLPPVEDGTSRPGLDVDVLHELTGAEPTHWELRDVMRQVADSPIHRLAMDALAGQELQVPPGQHEVQTFTGMPSKAMRDEVLTGQATFLAPTNGRVAQWNLSLREAADRELELPVPGDRLLICRNAPWFGLLNGDEVEVLELLGSPVDVEFQTRSGQELWTTLVPVAVGIDVPPVGQMVLETHVVHELLPAMRQHVNEKVDEILRVDLIRRAKIRPGDPAWYSVASADSRWTALRATYAYARTAHRAQGSEWRRVAVDVAGAQGGDSGRSWTYTAFTRASAGLMVAGMESRRVLKEGELEPLVRDELRRHGFTATLRTIDATKVQARVASDGNEVVIDVHTKKGLPSKASVKTGEPLGGPVGRILTDWCRRTRAELCPPHPVTSDWFEAVAAELGRAGLQSSAYRNGNQQVMIEAVGADGGHAQLMVNHDVGGWPSTAGTLRAESDLDANVGETLFSAVSKHLPT